MQYLHKNINGRIGGILKCALFFQILVALIACNKQLEIDPPITKITGATVFQSNSSAISALNGIYFSMVYETYEIPGTIPSLSLYAGLSADEFVLWDGISDVKKMAYYKNELSVNSSTPSGDEYWTTNYALIYRCNSAIEGLTTSSSVSENVKKQLLGEAKFLRGLLYYYLANLYGKCPIVLSSDYTKTVNIGKSSIDDIYKQIISDLKDAKSLLSSSYLNGYLQPYSSGSIERVRPTTWAASALLSKAYLFTNDFQNAELESTTVINNSNLFGLTSLNSVFKMNSKEAIFQLQPTNNFVTNTHDGLTFVLPEGGPNSDYLGNPVFLSPFLVDSFELGDQRKIDWIGSRVIDGIEYFYPLKYKTNNPSDALNEYNMILRLGEVYLNRAEARANLNNIQGAVNDLNTIRKRARSIPTVDVNDPLPDLNNNISKNNLIRSLLHERKMELFTELGSRWIDMKRFGVIDMQMTMVSKTKNSSWQTNWSLYPIPKDDVLKAPQVTQNSGY